MPAPNLPAPKLHPVLQKAIFKANKKLQPPRLTSHFEQPSHLSVHHMKFTSPKNRQCIKAEHSEELLPLAILAWIDMGFSSSAVCHFSL